MPGFKEGPILSPKQKIEDTQGTEKERRKEVRNKLTSAISLVLGSLGYTRNKNTWTKASANALEMPKLFRLRRSTNSHTYFIDGSHFGDFEGANKSAQLESMVEDMILRDASIPESTRTEKAHEARRRVVEASSFEASATQTGKTVSDEVANEKIEVLSKYLEMYGLPWIKNNG